MTRYTEVTTCTTVVLAQRTTTAGYDVFTIYKDAETHTFVRYVKQFTNLTDAERYEQQLIVKFIQ